MARPSIAGFIALYLFSFGNVQGRAGVGSGEQEWDYSTVRRGAHMFWWLYFTTNEDVASHYEKPLLIWLQGGPGASSTGFGNFEELGPYDVNMNPRNYTWVKDYNVLFIDNPVGTGFSYVENNAYATTNAQIASDLVETMRQFFKKFPKFRSTPTYITCESYGGKMSAEFALEWYKAQTSGTIDSKLMGVGLGDSWISPIDSVLTWAPFLLKTGMIDTEGFKRIQKSAMDTKAAVDAGKWLAATSLWSSTENVISAETGGIDFYNILTKKRSYYKKTAQDLAKAETRDGVEVDDDFALNKLMNGLVKNTLKLNVSWGAQGNRVFSYLSKDFMKPVTHIVDRLLEETDLKVCVYTGHLDLIVDTPGTLLWVEKLKWNNIDDWKKSIRSPLTVNNIIEGYIKKYNNFSFIWVSRSGHMVPSDNPAATSAILKHLIGQ
ncbi:retinoid-inducible serine carboxypeptidase-like [Copidosoma floridanum]|uniref:retinoid-inducible serine carboxypeptidase-like n=1 Tax=Copidosoma floridanum TaxID=29053 RepID=UPI0006C94E1F|nr:retinoid-inducible serine carboxypeptidase-like [Copidosoma floridanum]